MKYKPIQYQEMGLSLILGSSLLIILRQSPLLIPIR